MKRKRISYSSYGAEILGCTGAHGRGFNFKMAMPSVSHGTAHIPNVLNIDSKGLYDTITTLDEGKEYRLRQTVQRIRDSFEPEDLDILRCVQGIAKVANAINKRNPIVHRMLNKIASTGRLILPSHQSFKLNSSDWL